ncbi:MAG: HAD hydrolase-like protein [Oscillospiraceae bacterium]
MKNYKTVLFDFDGTILNTYTPIKNSMVHAMRELFGFEFPPDTDFSKYIGPPLKYNFEVALGLPEPEAQRASVAYRDYYNNVAAFQGELYPGIREMLFSLHAKGIRLGIASSKAVDIIEVLLRHDGIFDCFDCISGLRYVGDLSTKTDAIERAVSMMQADKRELLMVGDRVYDSEGALNAGVDFAAALWGFGPRAEFEPYPCALYAVTPPDISHFVLEER